LRFNYSSMSEITAPTTMPSQKRPLEDPSSPSAPGDLPDAKRPALDKVIKSDATTSTATVPEPTSPSTIGETPKLEGDTKSISGTEQSQTHPIPTTISTGPASNGHGHAPHDESKWLHLRAIISSQEAATIIGKGGENVSQIRRMAGAKCTISDYTRGAVERILTVNGPADAVAKVG
jgi:heterogeneous nuclear rnp K-like protein